MIWMKMMNLLKNELKKSCFFSDQKMELIENFWNSLSLNEKPNQLQRYELKNSPECIRKFIALGGGPKMGCILEAFARFKFKNLNKRGPGKNSGFDHTVSVGSKLINIEQKSSGHWGDDDYKWQHVEPNHKWDFLLLCGVDYTDIKFWMMDRETFDKLVEENKITNQGNKEKESAQGMWFNYSNVKDQLIPIETDEDIMSFAQKVVIQ